MSQVIISAVVMVLVIAYMIYFYFHVRRGYSYRTIHIIRMRKVLGIILIAYGIYLATLTGSTTQFVIPGIGAIGAGAAAGAGIGFAVWSVIGTLGVATGGIGIAIGAAGMALIGAVFGGIGATSGGAGFQTITYPLVSPLFWVPIITFGLLLFVYWGALSAELIAGRYQVRGGNGEIIRDTNTGLEWQRCSLGQTWNGQTCIGNAASYNWDEARAAANNLTEWRLPTIDELRTLVFCSSGKPAQFQNSDGSCHGDYQQPTIVTEAFPNTPSSRFWSGSPFAHDSNYAWVVLFLTGYAYHIRQSHGSYVRLVRGRQ